MRLIVLGEDLVAASFLEAASTAKERIKDAAEPVAQNIAQSQKQMAPDRTGATQRSVSAVEGEDDTLWEIGPETFYSRFLEDGTVKMSPRPFVGPAGDLHEPEFYRVAEDAAADV